MQVTVRYADDCPNWRTASARLREALDRIGRRDVPVMCEEVGSRPGPAGSPTILVDGRDPFVQDVDPGAAACRLYANDGRLDGAPSVEQLVEVLAPPPSDGSGA